MNKYGDLLNKADFFLKLAIARNKVKIELESSFSVEKLKDICRNHYAYGIKYLITDLINYADQSLKEPIGRGSSRIVYRVNAKKVLKIAKNNLGLLQNQMELDVFTNPEAAPMVTKIYDYDANNSWIISEIVREIKSHEEFEKLTGMAFIDFYDALRFGLGVYDSYYRGPYIESNIDNNELVLNTIKTIKATGLMLDELYYIGHWGKTADNRVVVLDYGYSEDTPIV